MRGCVYGYVCVGVPGIRDIIDHQGGQPFFCDTSLVQHFALTFDGRKKGGKWMRGCGWGVTGGVRGWVSGCV